MVDTNSSVSKSLPRYGYPEAAPRLGVAEITLRQWASKGRIGFYKLGSRVMFSEQHIEDFLRRSEHKAQGAENV